MCGSTGILFEIEKSRMELKKRRVVCSKRLCAAVDSEKIREPLDGPNKLGTRIIAKAVMMWRKQNRCKIFYASTLHFRTSIFE